jgi:hypothetical protein
MTLRIRSFVLALLLAVAAASAVAPPATAMTWEELKEDFRYQPLAYLVTLPAFVVTAPFMLASYAFEQIGDDEEEA